jgi:hypothetical protein
MTLRLGARPSPSLRSLIDGIAMGVTNYVADRKDIDLQHIKF